MVTVILRRFPLVVHLVILVVALVVPAFWPISALAQEPKAGVVTTLQGAATVARVPLPQEIPLKFKDDVLYRDRITTKEQSIVRVLLGGKALITVRELSVFTITEEPGRAFVDLDSGKIALAVARQRLRPGEAIEVRTPNAIAAVRGTVMIVEVAAARESPGAAVPVTQVHCVQGVCRLGHRGSHTAPVDLGPGESSGFAGPNPIPTYPTPPTALQGYSSDPNKPPPEAVTGAHMDQAGALTDTINGIRQPPPPSNGQQQQATTCPPNCPPPRSSVIPVGPYFLIRDSNIEMDDTPLATFSGGSDPPVVTRRDTISQEGDSEAPSTRTEPIFSAEGANISVSGDSGGPVIEIRNSTVTTTGGPNPLFDVSGTNVTTSGLLAVDPSTVILDGNLLALSSGATLTSGGTLFSALNSTITATGGPALFDVSSSTLNVTGSGSSLLSLSGSDVTLNGSFLVGSSSTISVNGPLLRLQSGSMATLSGAPAIVLNGGSLTADALAIGDSTGNTLTLTGPTTGQGAILELTNATVTLRTLGEEVPDNDNDVFTLNLALNKPAIKMSNSTLNLTGVGEALVDFGENTLPIPTEQGVALVATNSTINLKGNLLDLEAVTSNATDALVQLNGVTVNQTGTTDALISVDPNGKPVTMAGPMLYVGVNSNVTASGPVFHFQDGSLMSNTTDEFVEVGVGDTVKSASNFLLLDKAFTLTLKGTFLSATSSTLCSGTTATPCAAAGSSSFVAVAGGSTLKTTGTADPLFFLSGGSVTAGSQFLHVIGAGSKVELSGTLLVAEGATITTGNNLVRIFGGGSLSSTSTDDMLLFTGGSFTGGGTLNTASGGSLLRMFSETGQPGTSLILAGPYVGSSGGTTFLSKDAPTFNIADGATINAASNFALFGTGSATSAFSFFNIETNTSFTPPGQPTVVGSGAPVAVTVGGTLIGGANFKFITQNNGSFLRLRNGVTLTQTGKSALVALDGTGLASSDFAIDASGSFLSMTAGSGRTPPSLTLGGSLLDASNAKIKTGDPAANAFSFAFVGDGATLTGPTDPPPLLNFSSSSVQTAGNILTVRRSKSLAQPSTVTLSGQLFNAVNSTFNTTNSGGFALTFPGGGPLCCDGFFVAQGGQVVATTNSPLIQLTDSTFTAGTNFLGIRDTFTGAPAGELVAPGSVTVDGNGTLVEVTRGSVTAGAALLSLKGVVTGNEVADGVNLMLGTDQPLRHVLPGGLPDPNGFPAPLFQTTDATVTAVKGVKIDTALLVASAPLLNLLKGAGTGSNVTFTNLDPNSGALDLSVKAKVTSVGPMVKLDGSTLTINNGAGASVAGGSFLKVTGDFIQLGNASTLDIKNGPGLSVIGGSVVNISGALVKFVETFGNTLKINNALCGGPCATVGGIPVFASGGAVAGSPNVFISGTPIKNQGTNTVTIPAGAAVIRVDGASSKVTISGL